MKFSPVVVNAALAGVTLADLATIQGAITNVQNALAKLDTAVKAIDASSLNSATPILAQSQNVATVIQAATKQVSGTDALGVFDALNLQSTAQALTTSVQTTIGDLSGKKAALDKLGVTSVAVQTLQQQKTDSAALGKAIVSKVPAIGQSIAQQSIDAINTAIDQGISTLGGTATSGGAASNSTAKTTRSMSTMSPDMPGMDANGNMPGMNMPMTAGASGVSAFAGSLGVAVMVAAFML